MSQFSQQKKDLFFTLINHLWRLVSGPLTMLVLPLCLSPEQQGYWYLFGGLSALSTFADLGFSNIILQFSAHEYAFLNFTNEKLLAGDEQNLKKLGSFFRFTVKWISTICTIVFPIIYVIGIAFFIRDQVLAIYFLPWSLYAVASLFHFFNNSILSFIEGLNKIAVIQKIRFWIAVLYTCTVIALLLLDGNIYALAFGQLLSASLTFIAVFGNFKNMLKQLLAISKGFVYSWRKEVVPLFLRYALSFASGYFIFQVYTPLMHYFHGAVYSGKIGMTMTLVTSAFNMSNIWMYTIIPEMNMLISQKLWPDLDKMFIKRLLLSIGSYLAISLGIFVFVALFGNFWIIPNVISRFLPGISLLTLLTCYLIQIVINAWALYLRGHKQEPYLVPSILFAAWTVIATFLAGKYLAPAWFFVGFLSGYIWQTPVAYKIYRKCKNLWHKE